MTIQRQFIAGATCPECGQVDKIVRIKEDDSYRMECVSCGMVKPMEAEPKPVEPKDADQVQPVRFLSPD